MSSCLSLPGGNLWLMTWWGRKGMFETLKNIYFYWLYLWLTILLIMVFDAHDSNTTSISSIPTSLFQGHQHHSLSLYPFQFRCLDNLCVLPLCCFWTFSLLPCCAFLSSKLKRAFVISGISVMLTSMKLLGKRFWKSLK